jgi:uncharacterized metal-binding protein
MPSGRTHDAITFLLAAPVFAASWQISHHVATSSVVTAAFVFGGLMFGPDLDTLSRQYSRWSFARALWLPYRWCFPHRSRWSHGLIFGTLLRVIYFMGIMTLAAFGAVYAYAVYAGGNIPGIVEFTSVWKGFGESVREFFGESFLPAVFVGLWSGAASHTLTDMAGTFVKTGRVEEFL